MTASTHTDLHVQHPIPFFTPTLHRHTPCHPHTFLSSTAPTTSSHLCRTLSTHRSTMLCSSGLPCFFRSAALVPRASIEGLQPSNSAVKAWVVCVHVQMCVCVHMCHNELSKYKSSHTVYTQHCAYATQSHQMPN